MMYNLLFGKRLKKRLFDWVGIQWVPDNHFKVACATNQSIQNVNYM